MGKKNFNQGINSLLGATREEIKENKEQEISSENYKNAQKGSVKAGLKNGETRATLILNEAVISKLKAVSYWDRVPLKAIMNDALTTFITSYEEKNGKIKSVKKT